MLVSFGCMSFQKAITPAWIDKTAKVYCSDSNGNLPVQIPKLWWSSMDDAEAMLKLMDYTHEQRQILCKRMQEDDISWYAFIRGEHTLNISNAEELRGELFSNEGSVASILMGLTGLTLGGVGGAHLISKPKDKAKIAELEEKVKSNNKTNTGATV
jgi:hypothetical protein